MLMFFMGFIIGFLVVSRRSISKEDKELMIYEMAKFELLFKDYVEQKKKNRSH